jgi:hypothetical protein
MKGRNMKRDDRMLLQTLGTWIIIAIAAAVFLLGLSARGEEPLPLYPISGTILQDGDGRIVGFVQVDLLSIGKQERQAMRTRRDEVRERRRNMTTGEVLVDHAKSNWGKYTAALLAAVVADQTVIKNNGWLWHRRDSGQRSAGGNMDDAATSLQIANTINGNGNTINQTIVIQTPQGSGEGMQANTGDGGLANVGGE